jgi:predicted phosphodiesterase
VTRNSKFEIRSSKFAGASLRTVGVVGDIHCEAEALQAALSFISEARVDRILAVGDIVDGDGDVNECCRLLQKFGVATVRGNHERWFLTGQMRDLPEVTLPSEIDQLNRAFISRLPATQTFDTLRGRLLLCHGLGESDMGGVWPDDQGYFIESNLALRSLVLEGEYRFVVNGHTHNRMVRDFDHMTIINAGTLYHDHNPCFLIADFEKGFVQFYDIHLAHRISKGMIVQLPAPSDSANHH